MSLRSKSREYALQMLFQWEITHAQPREIEQKFWKSARASASTRRFAEDLFEDAVARATSSDGMVKNCSKNWRLERLSVVDLNILRLSIGELQSGGSPAKVVLNEALELTKKFSSPEAVPFVNGILDSVLKSLNMASAGL